MDYTRQAKEVLKIAEKSAKEMAHPYVGTEYLLLGLRKVYTGVAAQVLGANGVDEENIQKVMSEISVRRDDGQKETGIQSETGIHSGRQ